jgi:energy-converting hydrogenase Eha subunit A
MLIIVMGIALIVMDTVLIILTALHFFFHSISNGKPSRESGTTSASISTLSSVFGR